MLLENMSKLRKGMIIFCAEYLVLGAGLIFLIFVIDQLTMIQRVGTVFSGGSLLLISLSVTKVLKRIIHKRRPPRKVEFFMPFDRYAFPSGHATALASISLFMIMQNTLLGSIISLISLIIVIARVQSRVHYGLDIVGGVIVGIIITYFTMPYVVGYVNFYLLPAIL
jgi:undecaprenyl-diphosphatase